jgi:multidrug resistance protein MdtO
MKKSFGSTLRLLARLAREPLVEDQRVAIERSYSLRETISASFDKVRSQSDAVLFEFGRSRQQDMALQDRIRRWQPQLRLIFLTRIALWKYRLQLPGFELPESVRQAQREFDNELTMTLEGMADRIGGIFSERQQKLEGSLRHIDQAAVAGYPELPGEAPTAQLQTFLTLSRRIARLASTLDKEI